MAGDAAGNVLDSTSPTAGAGAWTLSDVDGWSITGIACPPQNLCVAVDGWGGVLLGSSSTSTNPGPPGPPVTVSTAGRLVAVGRVRVIGGDKLRLRLACRCPIDVRCTGHLTLLAQAGAGHHKRKTGVGGRAIKLRGGRTQRITMRLDARGRRLLKTASTLRVRMAVTQGKRGVLNHRCTLREPPAHGKGARV